MHRIDELFERLRRDGRKAFMPFVTAGDPDLDMTERLVRELSARGASLIEIGVPYSDPIADGPVIQASYTRALGRRITLEAIFDSVRRITKPTGASVSSVAAVGSFNPKPKATARLAEDGAVACGSGLNELNSLTASRLGAAAIAPHIAPLVAMVSYAIVWRHGVEAFVRDAMAAGFEGAIVPDLPVEEAGAMARVAAEHDFKLILLVTPTTPRDRAVEIARASTGFLYFVSITGITGERTTIPPEVLDQVTWLKSQTTLPVCIGFGISRPEHVRMLAPVADGVIVGSAIVRRVADGANRPRDELVREVGDYVTTLIESLNR